MEYDVMNLLPVFPGIPVLLIGGLLLYLIGSHMEAHDEKVRERAWRKTHSRS